MKQGTISVLFGGHSIVHSVLVLISWVKLYKSWPKFWQFICIFLHDIGHCGLDYLDDYEQKKKHWELGARIALILFGEKGFDFVAGHTSQSSYPYSELWKPDKYSWYIAPKLWLYSNTFFEPKLRMNYRRMEAVLRFKEQVKESIESGAYKSNHQMYLTRCKNRNNQK